MSQVSFSSTNVAHLPTQLEGGFGYSQNAVSEGRCIQQRADCSWELLFGTHAERSGRYSPMQQRGEPNSFRAPSYGYVIAGGYSKSAALLDRRSVEQHHQNARRMRRRNVAVVTVRWQRHVPRTT